MDLTCKFNRKTGNRKKPLCFECDILVFNKKNNYGKRIDKEGRRSYAQPQPSQVPESHTH